MPFISIEGCDGSGKSTQAAILQKKLIAQGIDVVLTKEPGGSTLGNTIRSMLLESEITDSMTEFLLLSAARRDHVLEIKQHIKAGKWVITDRFSDSSLAYQGYAKGLDINNIQLITQLITEGLMPDLTILLDVSLNIMQNRMQLSEGHRNFYDMKSIEFHRKVKNGFLKTAQQYSDRIVIINADSCINDVSERILLLVMKLQ